MNLTYEDLHNLIRLEEGKANVLVIENPIMLREMIFNMINQVGGNEGKFILSEQDKILSIAKNVEFVFNPFNIEINKRKVLQKLYENLEKLANNEENFIKTQALKTYIKKYLYEIIHTSDMNLDFQENFAIKDVFSAVGVGFLDDGCTMLEKLVDFMEVCTKFLNIKILVFVNLSSYFDENEMMLFFKEAAYKKVQLILFEKNYKKIFDERLYVVDNDLCEVYCDE